MKKLSRQVWYFCLILLSQTFFKEVKAADNPILTYLDGSKNQIAVDSSVLSVDSLYYDPTFADNLIKPYDTKNIITFRIDEDSKIVLPAQFSATVTVRIIYSKPDNTSDSIQQTLSINYKADSIYTGRSSYIFNGAHAVKIKIISTNIPATVITALLVENEIIPNRTYNFTCLTKQIKLIKAVDTTNDELTVSWATRIGADEYDLEWCYIDSSALAAGLYNTPTLKFANNATRVSIPGVRYSIPLIFPGSGSLFVRVRPVQIINSNRITTAWSSDFLPDGLLKYDYLGGHEKNLNWQSTVSYAEDGKRKVVVQYYDGSLRSRQTVTKDNVINNLIVGETYYDYQGRPTIQVMPVPTLNTVIQYSQNFNKGINGVEYEKGLFDVLPHDSAACGFAAPAMDSTAGAGGYYSYNNTSNGGVNRYTPLAKGYPFSQTEYTQDNTGRISRQSGVGPTFKLGSGHETKYFYSITPDQSDLDGLFGTEVGERTHYFKNYVQDANGQYSVSYVDMHGRTIATALAGDPPSKLNALDSYDTSNVIETLADASTNITKDMVMESHKSLMVTRNGNFAFHYDLSPQTLQINNCSTPATSICYDCLYDLVITISDDCGNRKLGGQPISIKKSNFTLQTIDGACNNNGFVFDTTIFLEQGNYEVSKTLSASKFAQDYYKDSVYAKNSVCKSLATFISQQKLAVQQSLCEPSCATCLANVGSLNDYKHTYLLKVVGDTTNETPYLSAIQASYKEAIAACNQFCEIGDTAVNYVRQNLLRDMTAPSGQYANPDSTQNIYSIFYTGNGTPIYKVSSIVYTDEFNSPDSVFDNNTGIKVKPQDLSAVDFAKNFKPSWAKALLQYHPEYCKLQAYESHLDSYNWEKGFTKIETYIQAVTAGYVAPLSSSNPNKDPISTSSFGSPLLSAYNNYQTISNGSTTYNVSMWQMASLMAKCPTGSSACASSFLTKQDTTLVCVGDSNIAWKNFQQLYLAKKKDLLDQSYYNLSCTRPGQSTAITALNLLYANHYLNFISTSAALNQGNLSVLAGTTDTTILKAAIRDSMHNAYQSTCQSYAEFWMQQLAAGYTQQQINEIIPMLVDVCRKGSDVDHPYGSRDISPDSAYTYSNFDAVIKAYNIAHSLTTTLTRNADVITFPSPYNAQPAYTKPIISRPAQEECDKINVYYQQYTAYKQTSETFSQFLKRTENTDISDNDLTTLLNTCSTSGTGSCTYLDHQISLPPIFQKSTGTACIGCTQMNDLYSQYKIAYPDTIAFKPAITNQSDTTQQRANTVFAAFMNNKLGFSYSAVDYLDFMNQCAIANPPLQSYNTSGCQSCDSLQRLINQYFDTTTVSTGSDSAMKHFVFAKLLAKGVNVDLQSLSQAMANCNIGWQKNIAFGAAASFGLINNATVYGRPYKFQGVEAANNMNINANGSNFTIEFQMDNKITTKIQPILYYVSVKNYTYINDTIHYWRGYYIYVDTINSKRYLFCHFNDTTSRKGMLIRSSDTIVSGKWYHIAITSEGKNYSDFKIYLNGALTGTIWVKGMTSLIGNVSPIGVYPLDPNQAYSDGALQLLHNANASGPFAPTAVYLKNLRLYRRKLDAQEIFYNYINCNGNPYSLDSIKLYAKLNEGNGAPVDYSSNAVQGSWFIGLSGGIPVFNPPNSNEIALSWTGKGGAAMRDSCISKDLVLFCAQPPINGPMLCGKSQPAYPESQPDTINSCTDSVFYAVSTATELYKSYLDSLKSSFDSIYRNKCLKAYQYETFTVTHSTSEYHYTLYYYDQAGNLVQTVPPRAVHPNRSATFLQQVKSKRIAGQQLRPVHDFILGTKYLYNSLNQVIKQVSPDGGSSAMYYDRLGRLVLSQNAKQQTGNKYSYTNYDVLGRVTEVGELTNSNTMNTVISKTPNQLLTWLNNAASTKTQITSTVYDEAYTPLNNLVLTADNLRNRVSYSRVFATATDQSQGKHTSATFYSYDIHGNADTVVQDFTIASLPAGSNRFWKKMVYQYDLISGKVNQVAYQPGQADAFYERYSYDEENRLTNAESSTDSIYWENEAYYRYYRYGPLGRIVLGQQQVQGLDYAYTLQGWLKGVNTTAVNTSKDMGGDGFTVIGLNNLTVARDVYGFALHYYGKEDYAPVNGSYQPFAQVEPLSTAFKALYNGNIAAMSVNITQFSKPLLYNYGYDQLNRLVSMRVYRNTPAGNLNTNAWNPVSINDYNEDIAYDASGNILKYKRYADNATLMDSLSYKYYPGTNKLSSIKDNVSSTAFTTDIDNQGNTNYDYDAIGNLTKDSAAGIGASGIEWTVYGKISKITKTNGTVITYTYDAGGNRQSKKVGGAASGNGETWYVRDATGNVISVYTVGDNTVNSGAMTLTELDLYGSSRLGMLRPRINMTATAPARTYMNGLGSVGYSSIFMRGRKLYELTNHLGNVLATISDKKIGVPSGSTISYYTADLVSAQDYYPFGMLQINRSYTAGSAKYRYGFNGKENDNEVKGDGNQQDYGMRIYDPRVGKFLSVDPLYKSYPWYTPYQFAGNKPTRFIDRDGLEEADPELDREDDEEAEKELERERESRNLRTPTEEEISNGRKSFEEWEKRTPKQRAEESNRILNRVSTYVRNGLDAAKEIFNPSVAPGLRKITWNQLYPPVTDPYTKEKAEQSPLPEAMRIRDYVKQGGAVFRLGTRGISNEGPNAQFWSTIDPRINPAGYAKALNIPLKNVEKADFVEQAQVNTFATFITRPAAEDKTSGATNIGTNIEVVVPFGGTMNNKITTHNKPQ